MTAQAERIVAALQLNLQQAAATGTRPYTSADVRGYFSRNGAVVLSLIQDFLARRAARATAQSSAEAGDNQVTLAIRASLWDELTEAQRERLRVGPWRDWSLAWHRKGELLVAQGTPAQHKDLAPVVQGLGGSLLLLEGPPGPSPTADLGELDQPRPEDDHLKGPAEGGREERSEASRTFLREGKFGDVWRIGLRGSRHRRGLSRSAGGQLYEYDWIEGGDRFSFDRGASWKETKELAFAAAKASGALRAVEAGDAFQHRQGSAPSESNTPGQGQEPALRAEPAGPADSPFQELPPRPVAETAPVEISARAPGPAQPEAPVPEPSAPTAPGPAQPEAPAQPSAEERPRYADGRWIPREGESVYRFAGAGLGGTPAYLNGKVIRHKGQLRIQIVGGYAGLFPMAVDGGKTEAPTPQWTVSGDPEIARRRAEEEARAAAKEEARKAEIAQEEAAREAAIRAMEQEHGVLRPEDLHAGDLVRDLNGQVETVAYAGYEESQGERSPVLYVYEHEASSPDAPRFQLLAEHRRLTAAEQAQVQRPAWIEEKVPIRRLSDRLLQKLGPLLQERDAARLSTAVAAQLATEGLPQDAGLIAALAKAASYDPPSLWSDFDRILSGSPVVAVWRGKSIFYTSAHPHDVAPTTTLLDEQDVGRRTVWRIAIAPAEVEAQRAELRQRGAWLVPEGEWQRWRPWVLPPPEPKLPPLEGTPAAKKTASYHRERVWKELWQTVVDRRDELPLEERGMADKLGALLLEAVAGRPSAQWWIANKKDPLKGSPVLQSIEVLLAKMDAAVKRDKEPDPPGADTLRPEDLHFGVDVAQIRRARAACASLAAGEPAPAAAAGPALPPGPAG